MGNVNSQLAITTTSAEAISARYGGKRRLAWAITSLTAGVTATVAPGEAAAVANSGIPLTQNQAISQANGADFPVWQGPIQVIGSASGTISIFEYVED